MRPIIEQIDELIEGLFDGSILHLSKKIFNTATVKFQNDTGLTTETIRSIYQMKDQLLNNLIPVYMNEKGKKKRELARQIFIAVLNARSVGIIYNDENLPKELNWYRIQNERLNKENEKLRDNVTKLTTKILEIPKPSKDQKVGVV